MHLFASGAVDWLKDAGRRFFPISAPQTIFDNGAPGDRPGDEWEPQARQMIGMPLAKIQCDGCMAETETLKAVGVCASVQRQPDGGAPRSRVIWCAVGLAEDGSPFQVIVARCRWDADLSRYEERY